MVPRRLRGRINPVRAGAIALLIITVATWLAFTKQLPWRDPFQFHAVFQTSNDLRLDSPVRIAGVNVGEVVEGRARRRAPTSSRSPWRSRRRACRSTRTRTAKIRSRIFLEGNFFVDLSPGTPSADKIGDGDTIPVTQTATPVQLDQLLTALQTNDRESLQDLLIGLGDGLMRKPSAADDADQDPDVRGETAAKSLNDSITDAPESLQSSAEVNKALLGTEPRDLSKLIAGLDKVDDGARHQRGAAEGLHHELQPLLRGLRTRSRRASPSRSGCWGRRSRTRRTSLTSLNAALPDLEGFARDLTPGVEETPATITAFTPWISQAQPAVLQARAGHAARSTCSPRSRPSGTSSTTRSTSSSRPTSRAAASTR